MSDANAGNNIANVHDLYISEQKSHGHLYYPDMSPVDKPYVFTTSCQTLPITDETPSQPMDGIWLTEKGAIRVQNCWECVRDGSLAEFTKMLESNDHYVTNSSILKTAVLLYGRVDMAKALWYSCGWCPAKIEGALTFAAGSGDLATVNFVLANSTPSEKDLISGLLTAKYSEYKSDLWADTAYLRRADISVRW